MPPPARAPAPAKPPRIAPPEPLPPGVTARVKARDSQTKTGSKYALRGEASVQTERFLLRADEIDYDQATGDAEARGNVYMLHFEGGEELWADRVEYNTETETGKFYNVRGIAPVHIEARPGILTTANPFYFEGKWAERLEDRYILYDGFITNCRVPGPWWRLKGPKFDVIPNQRALAYNSVFRLRNIPIFYVPFFRKSLERMPRKSGFLTPNAGNSSRRGKMFGGGYYWAINRSYDASYRAQYFTQRGVAHTVDFRGKPDGRSSFDGYFYGVNDRGLKLDNGARLKQGGFLFSIRGRSDLGRGWTARVEGNYLSSMTFRQAFTETFVEAISSEVHSIAFVNKDWSTYAVAAAFDRLQAFRFQDFQENETVTVRKLPELRFSSRDRRLFKDVPVWISWESSSGLLRRKQPLFQTRQYMDRLDAYPRVMTVLRWKDFSLVPSFALRETHWGESLTGERVIGRNTSRTGREVSLALIPPSLERVYDGPKWLGDKVKHVIEPRLSFRHVGGIDNFQSLIRFDETELYSNTTEAEVSLTNRIYARRGGNVEELFSWQVWQRRFFDPDFGGALRPGERNVLLSSLDLTPYSFLDRPRRYSPIISIFRANPKPGYGIEWRTDYDPARARKWTNSGVSGDARVGVHYFSIAHNLVRRVRLNPTEKGQERFLSPAANEFSGLYGIGHENRRGWNAAFRSTYNFREGVMLYSTAQVTYNTDCCGFSVQYRRLGFANRNENQFYFAFAIANIGSFGTLKKQDRLF